MTDLCLTCRRVVHQPWNRFCLLRLCSTLQIQSKMDSAYLLESLAGNFMDVVQYNEDNRAFEVCVSSRWRLSITPLTVKNKMVAVHEDSAEGITRVKESEKLESKTRLDCWSVCVCERQIRGWILSDLLSQITNKPLRFRTAGAFRAAGLSYWDGEERSERERERETGKTTAMFITGSVWIVRVV